MSRQQNREILQELIEASSAFLIDTVVIIDAADTDELLELDIYQCTGCGAFKSGRDPEPGDHHTGCQVQRLRAALANADALLRQPKLQSDGVELNKANAELIATNIVNDNPPQFQIAEWILTELLVAQKRGELLAELKAEEEQPEENEAWAIGAEASPPQGGV